MTKVCQENIPHTITPPPPAWTVETKQDGSMLSCSLHQILHTLVATSGYLSYCCLSIISNQSAHSPLTSTRHFSPHNCHSLDILSFSDQTLEMDVLENLSRAAVFEILRPAHLAPTTIPRSKSLKSLCFPILMLSLNFSKSSSPHLDAWMHLVAVMWLVD